jgi:hypothetical protein
MLILIVLFPFLGFIAASLFGKLLGRGVCYIAVINIFLSLSFSIFLLYKIMCILRVFI